MHQLHHLLVLALAHVVMKITLSPLLSQQINLRSHLNQIPTGADLISNHLDQLLLTRNDLISVRRKFV